MNKKRLIIWNLAVALAAGSMAFPAAAAEHIDKVELFLESEIIIGSEEQEVYVESATDGVEVTQVTVSGKEEDAEWEEGMKPKVRIVLEADGGDTFNKNIGKGDIFYDGPEGRVSSVSLSGKDKLTVYIIFEPLSWEDYYDNYEGYTLEIDDAGWNESLPGTGAWEPCDDAKEYQVRLFRNEKSLSPVLKTQNAWYDFSEYITRSGDYTFQVRASRGSNKGEWTESDLLELSSAQAKKIKKNYEDRGADNSFHGQDTEENQNTEKNQNTADSSAPPAGTWVQDEAGWRWKRADGVCPAADWEQINGVWYYFNESGYMAANQWIGSGNTYYYCGETGAMAVNTWIGDDYVDENGLWIPSMSR